MARKLSRLLFAFLLVIVITTTQVSRSDALDAPIKIQEEMQQDSEMISSMITSKEILEEQKLEELEEESPEENVNKTASGSKKAKLVFFWGVMLATLFFSIGIFEIRKQKNKQK